MKLPIFDENFVVGVGDSRTSANQAERIESVGPDTLAGCSNDGVAHTELLDESAATDAVASLESEAAIENASGKTPPPPRFRLNFRFRVFGDLRFISHHDSLRMFRRALARADLPVRFSQGFNPHPKMSLVLPRPVGISSDDEALVVEFTRSVDPAESRSHLAGQMPHGIDVFEANLVSNGQSVIPEASVYLLNLAAARESLSDFHEPSESIGAGFEHGASSTSIAERIENILRSTSLLLPRFDADGKERRKVDIRPWLIDIIQQGEVVQIILQITGMGTARPAEVAGLLGFEPNKINHCIHRLEVRWK